MGRCTLAAGGTLSPDEIRLMIDGQTNVLSQRFECGAVDHIAQTLGDFVVVTMEVPWQLTRDRLGGRPLAVQLVDSMEFDVVDAQVAGLPQCDAVVAVGGGRAIDFGKYMAWKRGCRLVTIPTVLSVDAFVTPQAGLRRNHRVEYVGWASPDPLVIDYDLLRTAPAELNIAGAGDLLSIHTATFDWELAQRANQSEYAFSSEDVRRARAIIDAVSQNVQDIRTATDKGLSTIVDGYMRVNTICLPKDHYRVEEGSEHYLFYELERRLRRPFIHGQIVALGIFVMSYLQENAHDMIVALMKDLALDYRPAAMGIQPADLSASLLALPNFVRESGLWYTIINERHVSDALVDELCRRLYPDS